MSANPRSFSKRHSAFLLIGAAIASAGAIACGGGSGGGTPSGPSGTGGGTTASCRTVASASRSVQTFVTGVVVAATTACTAAGTEAVCTSSFTDSQQGAGTIIQTSRFASRNDIVDEAATNPPLSLSLGTTIVMSIQGFSLTTTATNTYDAQRRLTSTTVGPVPSVTTTFSAWDSSGRPTASSQGAISYDNANRSVTRIMGLNTCTVTHDANGIIIKEVCTGTTASTTEVTVLTTQSVCK